MVDIKDADAGFDRRSLIKKGLVAGGIAATAPVISTFNVPAFAASPGTYRIQYNTTGLNSGTITRILPPGPNACGTIEAAWDAASTDPGAAEIPITVTASPVGSLTFTLTGDAAAECTFTAGRRSLDSCDSPVSGVGTTVLKFDGGVQPQSYYLIVTCV